MTRFADIQILRYELPGFSDLTLDQKMYIYCLSEAALWGRDITCDQFGVDNLRLRQELEREGVTDYLRRVWFANGPHHHYSQRRFDSEVAPTERFHIPEEREWNESPNTAVREACTERIVYWLREAVRYAETDGQRDVIERLIAFYLSPSEALFDDYSIAWVQATEGRVDFINGYIEVYSDPEGRRPSWEAIVHYKDLEATRRTTLICQNAQWFEDRSPVNPAFRKAMVRGVTATVVNAAMLAGDMYPASAIGINLPNADWIRAEHGSKSVTIGNLIAAYDRAARGSGMLDEFVIDAETRQMINTYGNMTDALHTDLHECLGHGSGQLLPGVSPEALGFYHSTIEEARADLFALYYLADEKLIELGIVDSATAYQANYYSYLMNGALTQMVRIAPGEEFKEAHMQNRAMIARWVLERGGAAEIVTDGMGRHVLRVNDYAVLRTLFAELLAEVQRIKSEGDREAAKVLIERYGTRLDPALHAEVLARYKALNIAPYKGFINPRLVPRRDAKGDIVDIVVDYSESYDEQMMRYSREYSSTK